MQPLPEKEKKLAFTKSHYCIMLSKISEFILAYFLRKRIKNDLIPDNYIYFQTPQGINDWAKDYFLLFKQMKNEEISNRSLNDRTSAISTLEAYAGNRHHMVNAYLRDENYNDVFGIDKRDATKIKEELIKYYVKENLVVVRKISNNCLKKYLLKGRKLKRGIILTDKGFLSTSLDLSYRRDNNSIIQPLRNETLMFIKVPKGANAIYLEPISQRKEYELLIQCGSEIVVERRIRVLTNQIIFGRLIIGKNHSFTKK